MIVEKWDLKKNVKFSELFDFRMARYSDLNSIMEFIRRFWSPNHILGNDKDFFLYEHGNCDGTINFIIAVNRITKEIFCIQGFIPYSRQKHVLHICGVMSKTHPNNKVPLLGVETMSRMLHLLRPVTYCGIGTNPVTMLPLVKRFFKRHTGVMPHYYMLNKNLETFEIAVPNLHKETVLVAREKKHLGSFELIQDFSDVVSLINLIKTSDNLPFKSLQYLKRRYFENPIHRYKVYRLRNGAGKPVSLFVTREVCLNNSRILHWVDYIGEIDNIRKSQNAFEALMLQERYEYIDCLCEGIHESLFYSIGFNRKEHDGKTIIPSYFAPFVQRNIKIHFEKSDPNLIIFGGDADADRPSTH